MTLVVSFSVDLDVINLTCWGLVLQTHMNSKAYKPQKYLWTYQLDLSSKPHIYGGT